MLEHDTEASPASETDVTLDSSTGTDATTQEAAATDVKAEESKPTLLDVVTDVVEAKAEDDPPEASSAEESATTETEKEDGPAEADKPETFEDLPFGRHPRFKEVLAQRNSARTEVTQLKSQVDEYRSGAESYAKITTFLEDNGISNDEMVGLFKVAALSKADPDKALEALRPLLTDLYERTGAFLPDDLRNEVEEGKITEERARELSRERARSKEHERRASREVERRTEVEESTQANARRAELESAYTDWESVKKAKDPDFAKKEDLIADRCRALIAEKGQPGTAAEMRAMLDQAHQDVTERLRNILPRKEETRTGPRGGSTTSATPAPKSFQEAIAIAASQGR